MELKGITQDGIAGACRELIREAGTRKLWAFHGEMGAGKTTLIKAICSELGVRGETASPTFALVNEYHSEQGSIFHFDFYRIRDVREAYDIGYEDYFYSGHLCLIEWPEKIESLLEGEDVFHVRISKGPDDSRTIFAE